MAFCLQNVQSLWDFCGQIMLSYFCTIPKRNFSLQPDYIGIVDCHSEIVLLKSSQDSPICNNTIPKPFYDNRPG